MTRQPVIMTEEQIKREVERRMGRLDWFRLALIRTSLLGITLTI